MTALLIVWAVLAVALAVILGALVRIAHRAVVTRINRRRDGAL